MSRIPSIRWRDSDREDLRKKVRNFNAKVSRLQKKDPEHADLYPEKISLRELKKEITTRKDLKYVEKSLEQFTNRGSEKLVKNKYGVKTTEYELQQAKRDARVVNRKLAEEKKRLGIPDIKENSTGSIKQNEFTPRQVNFDKAQTKEDWKRFKNRLKEQKYDKYEKIKMERYKSNYLKAIQTALGIQGLPLYDLIQSVDADVLYQKLGNRDNDELLSIQFISDPLPTNEIFELALEEWCDELGMDYDEYLETYNGE